MFKKDKHETLPQAVYNSRWHMQLMGWLASLTLEDEERQELGLPQAVCEYGDVFPNELVTPPTRHPKWVSSGGVTLRDCDSLTYSFSSFRADTCIHMHNF